MNLVTIFKAFNPVDAEMTRGRLEVAGFDAVIIGDLAALSIEGYSLATGGIRVQVPEDQAVEARGFLDAGPIAE
jgi:hypothetical protein